MRQIIDSRGRVIAEYDYSPFGRIIGTRGGFAKKNTFTYTGREYDRDSGLYYYRARYMDSRVGRFTTRDPLLSQGANHTDLHPYSYAANNPVRYIDPTGLFIIIPPGILGDPDRPWWMPWWWPQPEPSQAPGKPGEIKVKSIKFTTRTMMGSEFVVRDPRGLIEDYVKNRVKGFLAQETPIVNLFEEVTSTAKEYLKWGGIYAENLSSQGWLIDEYEFETEFKVYACLEDELQWIYGDDIYKKSQFMVPGHGGVEYINLRIPLHLKHLPDIKFDVLKEAAESVVESIRGQ